jgi:hypothetical protein
MAEVVLFNTPIEDYTRAIDPATMDEPFSGSVIRVLEHIKWQVDRESARPPFHAPIFMHNGMTHSPSHIRLFNGYRSVEQIPQSEYLTTNISVDAQYDRLLDISERFIAACMATRKEGEDVVAWRSDNPAVAFTRQLHPKGLLILVTAAVCWVG